MSTYILYYHMYWFEIFVFNIYGNTVLTYVIDKLSDENECHFHHLIYL